jgi:hypothetical protein
MSLARRRATPEQAGCRAAFDCHCKRRFSYYQIAPPLVATAMDNKPRKVASVDEVCVALCQEGDDLSELRLLAHRLRSVHAQYDDDTVSPFPLHELLLLGKAVTA